MESPSPSLRRESRDDGMSVPATSSPLELPATSSKSTLAALLESLRPAQWVKNSCVFAALIFARQLTHWHQTLRVTLAALAFCGISSAMYLLNDVLDASEDRRHPLKRLRPVASGRLDSGTALAVATLLAASTLVGAWILDRSFFWTLALYACLILIYSAWLKRVILIDVFVIATGFVLRVVAGGLVIHVDLSAWLIVCTTLLALFLALRKRRNELVLLGEQAAVHRTTLADYTPHFLDQLIGIVTASTVMSYSLYTLSEDVRTKFPGKRLEITVPFVLFGIFRYLYLVHRREGGGNPARLLFTDPMLLSAVVLWAGTVIWIIYF